MGDRRDGFAGAIITGLLANSADTEADPNEYVDTAWDIANRMVERDPEEKTTTGVMFEIEETSNPEPPLHVMTPGELAYIEESIETENPDAGSWSPPEGPDPKPSEPDIPIPSDAMSGDYRDLTESTYAVLDENRFILMDSISSTKEESQELAVEVTGLLWEGLVKFGFSMEPITIHTLGTGT